MKAHLISRLLGRTAVVVVLAGWTSASQEIVVSAPSLSRRGGERLQRTTPGILKSFVRRVEINRPGVRLANPEPELRLEFGDTLRTFESASAEVYFSNRDVATLWENSVLEIRTNRSGTVAASLRAGAVRISSAGPSRKLGIEAPHGVVSHSKTEFIVTVNENVTELYVLQGTAELANELAGQIVAAGERAIATHGERPRLLPRIAGRAPVQWWIYYPAVLDPASIPLVETIQARIAPSLSAYQRGDLVSALRAWPGFPDIALPATELERTFLAGLWLGNGHPDRALKLLDGISLSSEARALRRIIQTAEPLAGELPLPASPSEWLAHSYELQSQFKLEAALSAARTALERSPGFGFARAREAELLFALGRLAEAALEATLASDLLPQHSSLLVTRGFAELANNRFAQAEVLFTKAISVQPRLGDSWLGRGLLRWRQGRTDLALEDIRMAAAAEPTRSLYHSYLGKALADSGDEKTAREEFQRARENDPNDPTPLLYESLLDSRENRPIEALEKNRQSEALNGSRAVYRSRYALDQDRSTRNANLAAIYSDLGLTPLAITTAARSLALDYPNYSAHFFLATTYNDLRDPRQADLRFETAWFSEYLLANLLAPPGAGILSQTISQNEYSRLLFRDGVGFYSETSYSSNGRWQQGASQFGSFGGTDYSVDALYRDDPGPDKNRDFEDFTLSLQGRQRLTAQDTLYIQAIRYTASGGDTARSFDGRARSPNLRYEEQQEPLAIIGYHREWSPNAHTLFLAATLDGDVEVSDSGAGQYLALWHGPTQNFSLLRTNLIEMQRSTSLDGFSLEAQHIQKLDAHNFIIGGRFAHSKISTAASFYQPGLLFDLPGLGGAYRSRLPAQQVSEDSQSTSAYLHHQWQISDSVSFLTSLSYDQLRIPGNFEFLPVTRGTRNLDQISPGVAFIARPHTNGTFRAFWARSLSGLTFEQSFRLEPAHIAGFPRALRTAMPELIPGQSIESFGATYNHILPSRTFVSVGVNSMRASAEQEVGLVAVRSRSEEVASSTRRETSYRQLHLFGSVTQPLGDSLIIGADYTYLDASHQSKLPDFSGTQNLRNGSLHLLGLNGRWFHPNGLFAHAQGTWQADTRSDWRSSLAHDDGAVFNLYLGWRGWNRRLEVIAGIENLTDRPVGRDPLFGLTEPLLERAAVFSLRIGY